MNRLRGRRAVITGSGSGIGRASAIRFANEGASVLVVGRSLENTHQTVEMVRAAGGIAVAMVTDASVESNVADIVARCIAEFGGLDAFFSNIAIPEPIHHSWSRQCRSGKMSIESIPSVASSLSSMLALTWWLRAAGPSY